MLAGEKTKATPVFVREATGLVREFGTFEHLMSNLNGVVAIFAPAFTAWFIWYAIPGGSVTLAIVGSFLFGAFGYLAAFGIITATFPRAGAPYVGQSRILHPAIGWPAEAMLWLSILSFAAIIPSGYVIEWALAPGLYVLGSMLGSAALVGASSWVASTAGIIIVGTIFLLVSLIPAIVGVRALIRTFQTPLFIIATIGLLLTLGILLSATHNQFVSNFQTLEPGLAYSNLVPMAQKLNPSVFVPVSFSAGTFLAALGMTGGSTNSYWNAWAVGELKNARSLKRQIISTIIPGFILMASIILITRLEEGIVGRDQMIALTQIGTLGSLPNTLFGGGVVTISIPYILASSPWIVAFLMIAIISAAFTFMPITWLIASRDPFAWAFDRLIPNRFASVNERFHTPVFTLIFAFIIAEIFLIIAASTSYLGLLFSVTWVWSGVSIGFTCLACALLPARKGIWQQSPLSGYKRMGMVAAVVIGLIGFFYQMDVVFQFTLIPALGFGGPQTDLIIASYVIVFVLYWIIRGIRKRQGIIIDPLFKEIPPE